MRWVLTPARAALAGGCRCTGLSGWLWGQIYATIRPGIHPNSRNLERAGRGLFALKHPPPYSARAAGKPLLGTAFQAGL